MAERPQIQLPPLSSGIRQQIFVNAVVFAACFLVTMIFFENGLEQTAPYYLGLSWNGLAEGYGLGVLRFVTSIFAHSYFDPMHLVFNMVGLWLFGSMVEERLGRRGIWIFYFGAGLLGGVLQLGLSALLGEYSVPAIGASGALYGIMVYAACVAPRMRTFFMLELRWLVGILVGVGIYLSTLSLRHGGGDGVAHGGHLGGALFGWLAFNTSALRTFFQRQSYGGPMFPKLAQRRQERARQNEASMEAEMHRLLDKVNTGGMTSLTDAERRTLDRISKELRKR